MSTSLARARKAVLPLVIAAAVSAPTVVPALPASTVVPALPASVALHKADPAERQLPRHRAGQVVVQFRRTATPAARDRALRRVDAKRLPGRARVVAIPRGREHEVAAGLAADPAVAWAEPNYLFATFSHPGDEIPWTLKKSLGVGAEEVWGAYTGAGVRVAVVDSGVDATHPDLIGRVDVDGVPTPYSGGDDCGHGTAVAGVVAAAHGGAYAAQVPGSNSAGVAPQATIVPVKALSYDDSAGECIGDAATIAEAIRWAADPAGGDADVINLSFGHPSRSQAVADAVAQARGHGALLVAAAGNSGDRTSFYPAALPDVISVGGLARAGGNLTRASFSSFGAVDVVAPAQDVPVILAAGVRPNSVGAACPEPDPHPLCASGTSFAAPHVAGVAALLVEQHGRDLGLDAASARGARLRQWLLGTARAVPSSAPPAVTLTGGHGAVFAPAAAKGSLDSLRTLLSWDTKQRTLSPAASLLTPSTVATARLRVTDGRGDPRDVPVQFTAPAGGSVDPGADTTGADGAVGVRIRSAAGGTVATPAATILPGTSEARTLSLALLVLHRDENIHGVVPAQTRLRNSLDATYDLHDVFRYRLAAGERLEATAGDVEDNEYIDLQVYDPTARDVTRVQPAREAGDWEYNPLALRYTALVSGPHYLKVAGIGSYGLHWRIRSPGRVRKLAAVPSTFSPNADGYRDSTLISWSSTTRGRIVIRIADTSGRVRRTVDLGRVAAGDRSMRWNGRTDSGSRLPDGAYHATVEWTNSTGRYSRSSISLRVIDSSP